MSSSSAERDPVECLAEEFAQRLRDGERPSVTEYAQRHPEHAEEIRELFPALALMEKLKPGARIVSHYFKFGDIAPDKSSRVESKDDGDTHDIHLWTAPLSRRK